MTWKTINEVPIADIKAFVVEASKSGQTVYIGTDSMQCGKYTQFVTIVAVLTPMKGGRAAYSRELVPRISSLRERLLKEVWRSVTLGLELSPLVKGDLEVHIDANPVLKHKSSKYVQELTALVVSQGWTAKVKPESWAATTAADWTIRKNGKLPKGA